MSEIKFHTHSQPQAKVQFYILIFYAFRQQTGRQKVLDQMVANITQILSPLNFLLITLIAENCRSSVVKSGFHLIDVKIYFGCTV
jgi:hypothetical protein